MSMMDDDLWNEDDERQSRPHRPARRPRASQTPVAGRGLALGFVAAVVLGMAVLAAAWPAPAPTATTGAAGGGGGSEGPTAMAPVSAVDASAFCAAAPSGASQVSIYALNTSDREVRGTMVTVGVTPSSGAAPTVTRAVDLRPHQGASYNAADGIGSSATGSILTFDAGGVVVEEAVATPGGWAVSACPTRASSTWTLADGNTDQGNTLRLAIVNPTASPAVVNLSFLTDGGPEAPQPFQGITLAPGQLVVEPIGLYVQNAGHVATQVVAQSGEVVAAEVEQIGTGPSGVGLTFGTVASSTTWRLARTTTVAGGNVTLVLANPWNQPVTATVDVALSGAAVTPLHVDLPPQTSTAVPQTEVQGWPTGIPAFVSVHAGLPIVVSRTVRAPGGAPVPTWGSLQPTSGPAPGWIVPGPGLPGAPAVQGAGRTTLAIANPGSSPARVTVRGVGGATPVATVTIAPHQLAVVGSGAVGGLVPLIVSASVPVVVEDEAVPAGTAGVVATAGVPVPQP